MTLRGIAGWLGRFACPRPDPHVKTIIALVGSLLAIALAAGPKTDDTVPKGPPLVLPTLVVTGYTIPSYWLKVSWECANALPFCPIKTAWISKVGFGTPVAKLGIRRGDILLEFDGHKIGEMTGDMLDGALTRWRAPGAHLELTLQTPGEMERKVVIVFSRTDDEVDHHISK